LGRYLQSDPIGLNGGVSTYGYADANPVASVDPLGLTTSVDVTCAHDPDFCAELFAQMAENSASLSGSECLQDEVAELAEAMKDVAVVATVATAARILAAAVPKVGTEIVQRAMSRAELEATQASNLLRGGRGGTHHVSDAVNSSATRAQQRLALAQRPEVRVTLEVPAGRFSAPSRVKSNFNMPGGGSERTATGDIPVRIIQIDDY